MTSEMANISVGAAEGIEGWNTVLIRTKRGQELVTMTVSEGLLETGELPKANFDHLTESAQLKKR
jgi:coenzyme F420 hydrogenase subunit beta